MERLQAELRGLQLFAGGLTADALAAMQAADAERAEALTRPREDGPIARAVRENRTISIVDCIVDCLDADDVAGLPQPSPSA